MREANAEHDPPSRKFLTISKLPSFRVITWLDKIRPCRVFLREGGEFCVGKGGGSSARIAGGSLV